MCILHQLIPLFEANRNKLQALPMKQYMKNRFPYLGIKTPMRRQLMRKFYNETKILGGPFQTDFVQALWNLDEREYQYAAMDYIDRSLKKLGKDHLKLIEKLITSKSWWDTVDMLAQKPLGKIAMDSPEIISSTIEKWAYEGGLWLRRSTILFQLKYKEKTNEALLYRYIKHNAKDKEFFIQKAIGWALREYSKTNPKSVKQFIAENELSKLSIREGSKYLK